MKSAMTSIVMKAADASSLQTVLTNLSNAFTEVGFVKDTTATTQINLAVAPTYPSSLTAFTYYPIGYEVRKLVASGQQTMYCKVYYAIYSYNTTVDSVSVVVRFQWGTTVDANGNIGGFRMTHDPVSQPSAQASIPSTSMPCWIASDGQNYLTVMISPTTPTGYQGPFFATTCERTRDQTTGAYDGQCFIYLHLGGIVPTSDTVYTNYAVSARYGVVDLLSGYSVSGINAAFATPTLLHGPVSGVAGAATLMPLLVSVPAIKSNATMAIGYFQSEVVTGTQFDCTMYGSTMTFVAAGNAWVAQDAGTGGTNVRPALRLN